MPTPFLRRYVIASRFLTGCIAFNFLTNALAAEPPGARPKSETQGVAASRPDIAQANQRIETEPNNPRAYFVRARLYEQLGELDKAVADFDQALKLEPRLAEAWQGRGVVQFKRAAIAESISDFDQFLKLVPAQTPHHWQRGISYYYAKRFEDGRKQFELHQTVNPNDVENAVWHFLCVARSAGLEKARASLISIQDDGRVPMMQVHALFGGKTTTEEVLKAARNGQPSAAELRQRLFYAHLYLALYHEATGDETSALQHMTKAAQEYGGRDYMSDVARVHLMLRSSKKN